MESELSTNDDFKGNSIKIEPKTNDEKDFLLTYLQTLIDLYKHHFDLFIKGASLYIVIMGVIFGYIFRVNNNMRSSTALSVFIAIISLIGIYCVIMCIKWLRIIEQMTNEITIQLKSDMPPLPYSGAKGVAISIMMMTITFFIVGLAMAIYFYRLIIIGLARGIVI